MGFLVLGIVSVAVFVAYMVFQGVKAVWRMPTLLNLPGAFFVFTALVSLSGWLTHDLFDGYRHIPAPDVPWYHWMLYLGTALVWYSAWILAFEVTGASRRRHHKQTND